MSENESLHDTLERLEEKLAATAAGDEERRAALLETIRQTRLRLDTGDVDWHQEVIDELEEAVDEFEAEHPVITGMISEVVRMLSAIGI